MLLLLLLAADPSDPPLVPIEKAQSESLTEQQRRADKLDVPLVPADDTPPPPGRPKRLLGTAVGALLGGGLTFGVWVFQIALLGGICGIGCQGSAAALAITGIGSLLAIGPIGPLVGNRIAGAEAPYWKLLLGTAAGGVLAGLTLWLFESIGFFQGPSSGANVAVGLTVGVLELMIGQLVASETGVGE